MIRLSPTRDLYKGAVNYEIKRRKAYQNTAYYHLIFPTFKSNLLLYQATFANYFHATQY